MLGYFGQVGVVEAAGSSPVTQIMIKSRTNRFRLYFFAVFGIHELMLHSFPLSPANSSNTCSLNNKLIIDCAMFL